MLSWKGLKELCIPFFLFFSSLSFFLLCIVVFPVLSSPTFFTLLIHFHKPSISICPSFSSSHFSSLFFSFISPFLLSPYCSFALYSSLAPSLLFQSLSLYIYVFPSFMSSLHSFTFLTPLLRPLHSSLPGFFLPNLSFSCFYFSPLAYFFFLSSFPLLFFFFTSFLHPFSLLFFNHRFFISTSFSSPLSSLPGPQNCSAYFSTRWLVFQSTPLSPSVFLG